MPSLLHQFGRTLRKLRLEHNWTQEQLAEHLQVSTNFLSYMERGIKAPSFPNIERIAGVFKVPASALFEAVDVKETRRRVSRAPKPTEP